MRFPELNIVEQGVWNPPNMPRRTPLRFVLYYELEIHHENGGVSFFNGESVPCYDGLVTFSKPGDLRYSSSSDRESYLRDFVRFEVADDPGGLFKALLENMPTFFTIDEGLKKMWEEFNLFYNTRGNEIKRMQAYMKLLKILIYLSEKGGDEARHTKPPSAHQKALFSSIRYMRDRLDENLSISQVARSIGYSPSHFNHLFKQYTKTTPHAYYQTLRMHRAGKLLTNTGMTVSQISDALAFGNVSKFSYAFRGFFGMTPSQFRKLARQ